jgi:hypothetical protein
VLKKRPIDWDLIARDYDQIFYGRERVLTGADREHAGVSMLALHLDLESRLDLEAAP